jgi:uncharacterized protein YijF (DUF1287 family)
LPRRPQCERSNFPDLSGSTFNLQKSMKQILQLCATLMFFAPWLIAEQVDRAAIARSAHEQIGQTLRYDPSYRLLDYPMGDVPLEVGVCTDVVVRALRSSLKMDLQQLVHEDMKANFGKYPKIWNLTKPDRNIDHRRVPNLQTFFKRKGWSLPLTEDPANFKPGDLVTCIVPPHLPHIMIVGETSGKSGRPVIIHNIGNGTREEDRLFEFKLTGHYRVKASPVP